MIAHAVNYFYMVVLYTLTSVQMRVHPGGLRSGDTFDNMVACVRRQTFLKKTTGSVLLWSSGTRRLSKCSVSLGFTKNVPMRAVFCWLLEVDDYIIG